MRSRICGSDGGSSARKKTPLLVPPRMSTAVLQRSTVAQSQSVEAPRKMRILVVEDDGELVVLLAKALARAGLDVDSARNAADAEASLRSMHYAAVVLD